MLESPRSAGPIAGTVEMRRSAPGVPARSKGSDDDGPPRRGDRPVVFARLAGGRHHELQALQGERIDSRSVRVDPLGVLARQKLAARHAGNRLGQGDRCLVPPLREQVPGLVRASAAMSTSTLDSGSETITADGAVAMSCCSPPPTGAHAYRRPADDAAHPRTPGGWEIVSPDDRRQPVC